jgi:hypothetical protein
VRNPQIREAGRERTAHGELSSQTKTKKSMMQQANSAASLVGSVRDAAREQEGDNAVKPKKRKVRTELPDDSSKRSTSINDVVHQIDAQKTGEDLVNRRGNVVEAGKQGRPPDDGPHEGLRATDEEHLRVRGVGVIEDDEPRRRYLEKGDARHPDARHVESPKSAASPVGRGKGGEGSTRALSEKRNKVFGQPKHSRTEQEVAMLGHLEKSVEEKGGVVAGRAETQLWNWEGRHVRVESGSRGPTKQ